MLRYVARRGGLSGKTGAEEALVDMVCEGVKDARGPVVSYPFALQNPDGHREIVTQLTSERSKRSLTCFESILERGGWRVAASGTSTADVLLAELAHELLEI